MLYSFLCILALLLPANTLSQPSTPSQSPITRPMEDESVLPSLSADQEEVTPPTSNNDPSEHTTVAAYTLCVDQEGNMMSAPAAAMQANQKTTWPRFFKEMATSLSLGCFAGAMAGSACQTMEKNGKDWMFTWLLTTLMRVTFLNAVLPSLESNNIPHNKAIIFTSAWATDWLVYIYEKNYLRNFLS